MTDCHASRQTNVPSNSVLFRKPKFFKLEGCGVTPNIPSVLSRRQAFSFLLQCSFAAVIRVITQHFSPLRRVTVRDGLNAKESCNILQASAAKETGRRVRRDRGCSIDDVIVYGRNELWVIKKHMVKCRVEPVVVCIYFG